jgi:hypothetical protein
VIRTAVTNLLTYSEEFDQSAWFTPVGVTVTANAEIAPNGTLTADRVQWDAANKGISQSFTGLNGVSYALSVWVKGAAGETIRFGGNNIGSANFTLTGQWQRLEITGISSSTSLNITINTFVGVTARDLYVWGAQLEQSSTVGQYVKTTTAKNGAPRFDHDPTTGESLGLLVEEDRQNLLEYSEDISQWSSTTGGSPTITPNAATAPDGTNTATLIENTGVTAFIGDATSYTSGTTYTFSGYFKANDGDKVAILLYSSGGSSGFWNSETSNVATTFDLTNGTFTTFSGAVAPTTSTITDAGNGWWRCSITATATATSNSANQLIRNISGGTEGIYAWGYQIEAGSFPTSYIPTEGSTVTRAADVASITGTNFSSWYEQDEGTVFTDTVNKETYPGTNVFPYILQIDDGTNNNRIGYDNSVLGTGYRYNLPCTSGGVSQGELNQFGFASGAARWASAFKTNDFALAINLSPSVLSTRTSGTLPNTMTQLQIGKGFGKEFNGTIRRLTYWPTRLSNDTLQTITT